MVKPVGDYSNLEKKLRENSEREAKFSSRKMAMGFTAGAVFAAAMGFGGMTESEGHNQDVKQNPKEIKVTPQVAVDDGKTAQFPMPDTMVENTPEDMYQHLEDIFYEQLGKGIGEEKKVPQGVKLGERQGTLKEGDIPVPEFGRGVPEDEVGVVHDGGIRPVSPQLDPQDYDDGVVHGGKGIRTWQNEDDLSQVKDYRQADRQNSSKQAQVDLAMQMVKNIKDNHLG